MMKKVLSILLVLVLCAGLQPTAAFATEKEICTHHTEPTAACGYECAICPVQALINALPDEQGEPETGAIGDQVGIGNFVYKVTSDTEVMVTTGPSFQEVVTIPATITLNNTVYNVTAIGKNVFGASRLTTVTIPASVTSIGEYAFFNCESLTSVNYGGSPKQWAAISAKAMVPSRATVNCEKVDVTFDPGEDGSVNPSFQAVTPGGKLTAPLPEPTRAGYTFVAWYKEEACTNAWSLDTDTVPSDSTGITLYAKWEAVKYDLYIAGRQVTSEYLSNTTEGWNYDPDTKTLTLNNANISHNNRNAIESAIDGLIIQLEGISTVTSMIENSTHWLKNTTINGSGTLNMQGSDKIACTGNLTIQSGTIYTSSRIDADGIIIKGGYLEVGGFYAEDITITGGTVTAQGNEYGANGTSFTISGGNVTLQGKTVASRRAPTITNCTVIASTSYDGSTPVIYTPDRILFYKYLKIARPYTVTFEANGGTPVPGSQTLFDGEKATAPTAPTKEGYTLVGWYKEEACTNAWDFAKDTVTGNVTLYAKWTLNSYSVTVTAQPTEGGTVTGGGTYDHGGSVTLTATPNTGYQFVKWTEGGTEVSTDASYSFSATADRNLVAVFALNSYSVTAQPTEGGTVTGSGTYDHGDSVTLTATANTGYQFVKWTENDVEVSTNASYQFTATANRTLVAVFERIIYTVTFDANGGSVTPTTATTGNDGTLASLPTPTNTGYGFDGWYDARTGGNKVDTTKVYTENTTLYAHWSAGGYIIFAGNEQTVTKGSPASFTSNAPFAKFAEIVLVDNDVVDPKYYTAVEGSTKITLTGTYTSSLKTGEHTLTIVSDDGSASTTFKVKARAADSDSPQTGDTTNSGLWLALAGIGMLGFLAAILGKKYYLMRR